MRALLVVALLAIPAPALADQAAADAYHEYAQAKIAAMRAAYEQRQADQKALCAKVGGVRIGLTAAAVRASCWGKPSRINTTQTATHTREQWVYGASYVYLTDGVVDAIQTAR